MSPQIDDSMIVNNPTDEAGPSAQLDALNTNTASPPYDNDLELLV